MRSTESEAPFPARVYWLVLGTSALIALLLWWFTDHYNVPLEAP